jgi:hypothetical protein
LLEERRRMLAGELCELARSIRVAKPLAERVVTAIIGMPTG